VRRRLEALEPVESIEASWQDELEEFREMRREFFLYPD
jgi:hypothetical protein